MPLSQPEPGPAPSPCSRQVRVEAGDPTWDGSWSLNPHKCDPEPHKHIPWPQLHASPVQLPLSRSLQTPRVLITPWTREKAQKHPGRGLRQRAGPPVLMTADFPFWRHVLQEHLTTWAHCWGPPGWGLGRAPHSEGPWHIRFTSFAVSQPPTLRSASASCRTGPDTSMSPWLRASHTSHCALYPDMGNFCLHNMQEH